MTNDDVIKLCSLRAREVECEEIDPILLAQQGVVGWVMNLHPKLKNESLLKQVFAVTIQNQRNTRLCDKVIKALNQEGIEVALLKGAALMTSCYKEQYLRPIGDIDIWVKHEDAYRAHDVLKTMSATYHLKKTFRTNVLQESIKTHLPEVAIDGQIVELHYNMYSADSVMNAHDAIENHIKRGARYAILDDEMMLYHLTTHVIKNKRTIGLRVGWIVDLIMLFDKWGEASPDVCKKAIALNPSMSAEMLEIWGYVVSLVPEHLSDVICKSLGIQEKPMDSSFLEADNTGYKHGFLTRCRSAKCLFKASSRYISDAQGIGGKLAALCDVAHDIIKRDIY